MTSDDILACGHPVACLHDGACGWCAEVLAYRNRNRALVGRLSEAASNAQRRRDAEAERAALAAHVERLRDLAYPSWVQGCGDHSCLFASPTGMATNGGCRCHEGRQAARLVRALAHIRQTLAATPAESLEEHDAEVAAGALEKAATSDGGMLSEWQAGWLCERARALRAGGRS